MWMEARVIHGADRVLTTTERMRASMVRRYPTVPEDRFVCLPNGIDPGPLSGGRAVDKYGRFTVTYAGTLYYDRTPEPVFAAFGRLIREGRARSSDFCIKLVGSCRSIGGEDTMAVARRHGVEEAVEIVDRVPHAEAVEIMRRSHLLLVLAPPNHQLVLPAKIFDYLGSGSKLLALAEPGATSDLMLETDAGRCFSQRDVNGMKEYFRELLTDGRYQELRNEPGRFARYEARALAGQLVSELSDSTAHSDAATVRP
jgi:glycosyltransferase involved in cell wall biosynthesis